MTIKSCNPTCQDRRGKDFLTVDGSGISNTHQSMTGPKLAAAGGNQSANAKAIRQVLATSLQCQQQAGSANRMPHRSRNVEAGQDIPCWDEGEQHCGCYLKVGRNIHAHDTHVCEVIKRQHQEQQKPEELACSDKTHTHRHQDRPEVHGKQAGIPAAQEVCIETVQSCAASRMAVRRVKVCLTCYKTVTANTCP